MIQTALALIKLDDAQAPGNRRLAPRFQGLCERFAGADLQCLVLTSPYPEHWPLSLSPTAQERLRELFVREADPDALLLVDLQKGLLLEKLHRQLLFSEMVARVQSYLP
ncbi:MAG: hypothetical protein HC913_17610 [Microscillaceae bacterium]|nr:hypothetical protein [Microscillaceae bacterium]